jgi:hypothetical protein
MKIKANYNSSNLYKGSSKRKNKNTYKLGPKRILVKISATDLI